MAAVVLLHQSVVVLVLGPHVDIADGLGTHDHRKRIQRNLQQLRRWYGLRLRLRNLIPEIAVLWP